MSDSARTAEEVEVQSGHLDPYQLDPKHVLEPPVALRDILKKIGPGIVLSASIVGSASSSPPPRSARRLAIR